MEVNFLAMLVAALVPTLLGFIWYHPKVFGNTWMRATNIPEETLRSSGNMLVTMGLGFVFSFMLAFIMNLIAHHDAFVSGALFYVTNGTMDIDPASEAGKWFEHYKTNYSNSCRTFAHGSFHGAFIAGLFIALPVVATGALWEKRGFKYIAISAGYWVICMGLMGGIIAAWK